jgi:hypothetical protein
LAERRVIQGREVSVLEALYHAVEHFGMHTRITFDGDTVFERSYPYEPVPIDPALPDSLVEGFATSGWCSTPTVSRSAG